MRSISFNLLLTRMDQGQRNQSNRVKSSVALTYRWTWSAMSRPERSLCHPAVTIEVVVRRHTSDDSNRRNREMLVADVDPGANTRRYSNSSTDCRWLTSEIVGLASRDTKEWPNSSTTGPRDFCRLRWVCRSRESSRRSLRREWRIHSIEINMSATDHYSRLSRREDPATIK